MLICGGILAKLKPDSMSYEDLIDEVDNGLIKVPAFQRDFVWQLKDVVSLLDSIYHGYPIGSFLFWETNDYLHSLRNIGNLELPQVPEGRFVKYVLDGQQRITSLYAAVKEATVDGKKYVVYFDLENKKFVTANDLDGNIDANRYVSLAKILDKVNHGVDMLKLPTEEKQRAFYNVFMAFMEYPFPFVRVKDQPIEVVCNIFERINTKGKKLTVVDLMVAKTWSPNFDLRVKLDEFWEKLEKSDYSHIDDISILQSISCMLVDGCRRADILELNKKDFAAKWNDGIKAIELGIDFLRNKVGIPISKVLPFSVQIVPLAYFYYKNGFKEPNNEQTEQLTQWFWRSSLSNRYDSSVESKIGDDVKQVANILKSEQATFNYLVDLNADKIIDQDYSLKNAFCLTILSLYASKQPKNFRNNAQVDLTTKNFSKYNSKEMHHVFPRGFLKGEDKDHVDSVANICFIPSALNKDISNDAPSIYFGKFAKENSSLEQSLHSHIIGDLDEFGVTRDEFEVFLRKRAGLIETEFRKLANLPLAVQAQASVSSSFTVEVKDTP